MRRIIFKLILIALWSPFSCHGMQIYESTSLLKNGSKRVNPNGLTSSPVRIIHLGYVYDDADDVIHIIEPPQHFQELKRRQKQKQNVRTQAHAQAPKSTKIRKVTDANMQQQVVAAAAAATAKVVNMNKQRRKSSNNRPDSLTQETQSHVADLHLLPPPLAFKFPMEILASVRKTERILNQRQQHQNQQQPHAKQRIKTQETHTVIMEQGYEQSHFKRGEEQRFGGGHVGGGDDGGSAKYAHQSSKKAVKRVQRDLHGHQFDIKNETKSSASAAQLADANVRQGVELLLRLDALLKNATLYLPDVDADDEVINAIVTPKNKLLHELRSRFEEQHTPKKLIGEIEPTSNTPSYEQSPIENDILRVLANSLNATDALMQQIMRKHQQINGIAPKCEQEIFHEVGDSLQQFRFKIDCMRQQLEVVQRNSLVPPLPTKLLTTTTVKPPSPSSRRPTSTLIATTSKTKLARGQRRFGARTAYKFGATAATITTTTSLPTTQNQNLAAAKRQRQGFNKLKKSTELVVNGIGISNGNRIEQTHSTAIIKTNPRKLTKHLFDTRNVSAAAAALLYDDVMTNIRNMLEAKQLNLLVRKPPGISNATEKENDATAAFVVDFNNDDADDDFIEASPSSKLLATSAATTAVQAESHFRDLSLYLSGLQQIMSRFPHLTSTPTLHVPHESTRYARTDGGNVDRDASFVASRDWYLINDEGKISETPLDSQLQPSASVIFHRFPDIPNASAFYSKNHAKRSNSESNNENGF